MHPQSIIRIPSLRAEPFIPPDLRKWDDVFKDMPSRQAIEQADELARRMIEVDAITIGLRAAREGFKQILRLIIEHRRGFLQLSVLSDLIREAATHRQIGILQWLLRFPNATDRVGTGLALVFALRRNHPDVYDCILESLTGTESILSNGLDEAVRMDNASVVTRLLEWDLPWTTLAKGITRALEYHHDKIYRDVFIRVLDRPEDEYTLPILGTILPVVATHPDKIEWTVSIMSNRFDMDVMLTARSIILDAELRTRHGVCTIKSPCSHMLPPGWCPHDTECPVLPGYSS